MMSFLDDEGLVTRGKTHVACEWLIKHLLVGWLCNFTSLSSMDTLLHRNEVLHRPYVRIVRGGVGADCVLHGTGLYWSVDPHW